MSNLNRWLLAHSILSTIALVALIWNSARSHRELRTDLVRTRGVVVQDSLGRDRILIGAPFPASPHRIRTDSSKARTAWAGRLGGETYMGYYRDYEHSGNGILLLGPEGHDRLALGDRLPDPNTGRRITSVTGLLWNDGLGFERGGVGLNRLKENGEYRNGLGFDDEGGEGLHLFILEDGSKMLRTVYEGGVLYQGRFAANGLLGDSAEFIGYRLLDTEGRVVTQQNFLDR